MSKEPAKPIKKAAAPRKKAALREVETPVEEIPVAETPVAEKDPIDDVQPDVETKTPLLKRVQAKIASWYAYYLIAVAAFIILTFFLIKGNIKMQEQIKQLKSQPTVAPQNKEEQQALIESIDNLRKMKLYEIASLDSLTNALKKAGASTADRKEYDKVMKVANEKFKTTNHANQATLSNPDITDDSILVIRERLSKSKS